MEEVNEKDPTKKTELRKRQTVLNRQIKIRDISQKEDRAGTKPGGLTYAEMSKAINNAIDQSIGKIKGSDKYLRVDKDGNPARPSSQMPADMAEKAKAGALRWLRQNNLLDSNGAPIGVDATAIITSYGYWSPGSYDAAEEKKFQQFKSNQENN